MRLSNNFTRPWIALALLVIFAVVSMAGCNRKKKDEEGQAIVGGEEETKKEGRNLRVRPFDPTTFTLPPDLRMGQRVCADGDRTLVADALIPIVKPDSEMRRVGGCRDPELALYAVAPEGEVSLGRRAGPPGRRRGSTEGSQDTTAEINPDEPIYVKTELFRYLPVRIQSPETRPGG